MSEILEYSISYYSLAIAFLLVFPIFIKLFRFMFKKLSSIHYDKMAHTLMGRLYRSQRNPRFQLISSFKLLVQYFAIKDTFIYVTQKFFDELPTYPTALGIMTLSFISVLFAIITSQACYLTGFANALAEYFFIIGLSDKMLSLESVIWFSLSFTFLFIYYVAYRIIKRNLQARSDAAWIKISFKLVSFTVVIMSLVVAQSVLIKISVDWSFAIHWYGHILKDLFGYDYYHSLSVLTPPLVNIDLLIFCALFFSSYIFCHIIKNSLKMVLKYHGSRLVRILFVLIFTLVLVLALWSMNLILYWVLLSVPELYFLSIYFAFSISHFINLIVFPTIFRLVILSGAPIYLLKYIVLDWLLLLKRATKFDSLMVR